MGIDWEQILGSSGNDLDRAYDEAVSQHIYADESSATTHEEKPARLPWDEI